MAKFGFNDLHSFKDFVGFVRICAPDSFPFREGVRPDEQWSLDLAFEGLRLGLANAILEKGQRSEFSECSDLVEKAYEEYRAGHERQGYQLLDRVQKVLGRIRTH